MLHIQNSKIKVVWVDFFGVISTEVAPIWFNRYFEDKEEIIRLKEMYFKPLDIDEISLSEVYLELSALVDKSVEEISAEMKSLVVINQTVVSQIRELQKSYKIILCSNAGGEFLREIIREKQLENLFNEIVISSEIGVAKPDSRFFENCFELSDCKKEEIFFIDDNAINITAAEKFGVRARIFENDSDVYMNIQIE